MIVSAPTIDLNFEKNRRLMISISHSHNFVTYYIMLGIREKQKSRLDSPRRQKAITTADTMSPDGIQARLDELQKELIRKANSKQDYDAIADETFTLREQKSQSEADTRSREETRKCIAELQDFIRKQQTESQNLMIASSES